MRALSALTLLALIGCKGKDADPELKAFSSCNDLERYMRQVARLEASYNYAWSWSGGLSTDSAMMMQDAGGEAAPTDDESASSYSTTNTQEVDVDEDDLVKTDGTYLYALSGRYLTISKAYPTEAGEYLSKVEIDGTPAGIYLVDGYVIAVSNVYSWDGGPSPRSGEGPGRDADQFTLATVVDVADATAPVVERETYASGAFEQSRRVGDRLYVVTTETVDVVGGAEDISEAKAKIKAASAADFLPWRMDNLFKNNAWEVQRGSACDCEDVYAAEVETGTTVTNVLSLDLSDPLSEFQGEGVVGRAENVYASTDAVYVAYSEQGSGAFPSTDEEISSVIHKFDISDGRVPGYKATAKIPGYLSDQFAFSERDGVLRVATTEVDDDWVASGTVHTLEEQQGEFVRLGELSGLAPGEEIYAVRFTGDLGFVVTYAVQFGDPLFTIDLSDPTDIRQVGSLEVTGFSTYLHPMDDTHLLGVGLDEGGAGWQLAVSLFDVSDLENPVLADRELLDAGYSEAGTEHHAFNYFADKEVLAIPSTTFEGDSVLEILHATPAGLESTGRVTQDEVEATTGVDPWCIPVRRSVVMDDDIWAVSAGGLTAAAISDPATPRMAIPFTDTDPCSGETGYGEDW